ncbi:MAG: protein translocase SEC61 complex subunit gamma [Candidatus Saliniplasma sp.]
MDILEESWKLQKKIEDSTNKIGKGKYGRLLKMARKPTPEEYKKTIIICMVGIVLIGGLGFLIYLLFQNVPDYLSFFM